MMSRRYFLKWSVTGIAASVVAACVPDSNAPTGPTEAATVPPTGKPQPETPTNAPETATALPPTATSTEKPTETPTSTQTPAPTEIPMPTATKEPEIEVIKVVDANTRIVLDKEMGRQMVESTGGNGTFIFESDIDGGLFIDVSQVKPTYTDFLIKQWKSKMSDYQDVDIKGIKIGFSVNKYFDLNGKVRGEDYIEMTASDDAGVYKSYMIIPHLDTKGYLDFEVFYVASLGNFRLSAGDPNQTNFCSVRIAETLNTGVKGSQNPNLTYQESNIGYQDFESKDSSESVFRLKSASAVK